MKGKVPTEQTGPAARKSQTQADTAGNDVGIAAAAERTEDRTPFPGRDAWTVILDLEQHLAAFEFGPDPEAMILG